MSSKFLAGILLSLFLAPMSSNAQPKPRARDLGIPFEGIPGPWNAITDVPGVEVGQVTLIEGKGKLVQGKGPVRTGVTAIFPLGKTAENGVFGGHFSLNGAGELTGMAIVQEFGELHGPVVLTGTLNVGIAHQAAIEWQRDRVKNPDALYNRTLPVVGETWDGFLHDVFGFHLRKEHVFEAMNNASTGPVLEGGVGGGTGMACYEFKGGIGTASRIVTSGGKSYTLGVLVQANFGRRRQLLVAGVPVGKEITDLMPKEGQTGDGSIIVVVATDAPFLPVQLDRLARRVALGLARTGSIATNGSGDLFLAFSTATQLTPAETPIDVQMTRDINPFFEAVVYATEEAVINAIIAGETMEGINGNTLYGLPHERLKEILRKRHVLRE